MTETPLSRTEMRLMVAIAEADQDGKLFNPRRRANSRIEQTVKRLEERGLVNMQIRLFLMPKGRRVMAAIDSILQRE